ncbi:hypothetical protein AaE_013578 [Aphanomyces astaci]|uniref:Uncharacterized protein n=1 Tax=Aphanomyces astaci TaxID=112090 RepID=A0A6A4ZB83_APHAT|nr:hypothetical protein AaE_013578 [Aphanomyces astaci]
MAILTCTRVSVVLLAAGVVACFAYIGALKPPYWDQEPPAFNTAACAACANKTGSPCPNVFALGSPDINDGVVCSQVTSTCCCPYKDPNFGSVRCANTYTMTTPTCKCRYERQCGENCFLNEGLVPLFIGLMGCALIFCIGVGSLCHHMCKSKQAPSQQRGVGSDCT